MKLKNVRILGLALGMATSNVVAYAQSGGGFAVNWNTLDSAGGTCAGGAFSLNGTIGQPDAATAVGGSFALAGGFWPGLHTEIGPPLAIVASAGSVIISWPALATGFHLQHCTDLGRKNRVSNTSPAFVFGEDKVVVEPASGLRFYRLIKP